MNPGDYIAEVHRFLQSHPRIAGYRLATDSRGESFLYLSGTVQFLPGTTLDFKEFVEFPYRSSLPNCFGVFQTISNRPLSFLLTDAELSSCQARWIPVS